jgi:hypothetical protein
VTPVTVYLLAAGLILLCLVSTEEKAVMLSSWMPTLWTIVDPQCSPFLLHVIKLGLSEWRVE